jgi:hypothetical protein
VGISTIRPLRIVAAYALALRIGRGVFQAFLVYAFGVREATMVTRNRPRSLTAL